MKKITLIIIIRGADDLKDNDELKYVLTLMYHLIQEDDPYYTVVPGDVATWLNLKTLTGANDNKVLFELSDDTKKILNDLQDKFEKEVIEMDKIVCRENGWGNGIKGFPGMFKGKKNKRKDEVFSRVEKPILSDENVIKYGITDEKDIEFFKSLNELKRRVNAEEYYDRPLIGEVYLEILCNITGYLTQDLIMSDEEAIRNLAAIVPSISIYSEMMYDRGLRGAFWFIKDSISGLDAYKSDEDAVQIMTVHKSKGLEFPVVILASLRDKGFPTKFKENDMDSVVYIPDEFLGYDRYDGDAKLHISKKKKEYCT